MSNSKMILVATRQIIGGAKKGETIVLEAQAELTAAKAKAMGLVKDDIADLIAKGALAEVDVRVAEGGASGETAAETARADKAEAALKEANDTIAKLEADLAEATKPAAK